MQSNPTKSDPPRQFDDQRATSFAQVYVKRDGRFECKHCGHPIHHFPHRCEAWRSR